MKRLFKSWFSGLLSLILSTAVSMAVPEKVERAFEKRYENAGEVKWDVDSNGFWEGKFAKEGKTYRADFKEDGTWVESERSLEFDELPDAVKTAIRSEHGKREVAEIEEVDNREKGKFYDIEFKEHGKNEDVEYNSEGKPLGGFMPGLGAPLPDIENGQSKLDQMTMGSMIMEFLVNFISIMIYAYVIYYRRHHNHKMMFLLLAFNLFLFPIFMLSSALTMGFGFTIFALLALVRLRSENFDKAECAYLLGAVALTFINSQLTANVEIVASLLVLATAYFADHPKLWSSTYQTTEIRYRISDTERMLDRDYLSDVISKEFKIVVNALEINQVVRKEVRLTVVYSDSEERKEIRKKRGKEKKTGKVEAEKDESESK